MMAADLTRKEIAWGGLVLAGITAGAGVCAWSLSHLVPEWASFGMMAIAFAAAIVFPWHLGVLAVACGIVVGFTVHAAQNIPPPPPSVCAFEWPAAPTTGELGQLLADGWRMTTVVQANGHWLVYAKPTGVLGSPARSCQDR
jgi:hypothetical protein